MKRISGMLLLLCIFIGNVSAQNVSKKSDLEIRQCVLDHMERLRTAYNMRDNAFLNQTFDEGLYIVVTGDAIKDYTKQEFLTQIIAGWDKDDIKMTCDDIKVTQHEDGNHYDLTTYLTLSNNGEHNEGTLFLLWGFTNTDAPTIRACVWKKKKL